MTPTETVSAALTIAGTAVGTIAYMSPEQARGEALDQRTDIFSFGAVLYEMAARKPAFHGKTSAVVFKAILDETPAPLPQRNPILPQRLNEVVSKALEKDRNLRYQSAAELRTDLQRIKRDSESGTIAATHSDAAGVFCELAHGCRARACCFWLRRPSDSIAIWGMRPRPSPRTGSR